MFQLRVFVPLFLSVLRPVTAIQLDGNGYTDILVVISPSVPENALLISQIKEMFFNGSEYLFEALDHMVFFKEVKILVPPNWTTGKYESATTETFDKGRIRIDTPNPANGDDPYTLQTGGCGIEAEYIHFTPNFMLNNNLIDIYGPRGRVFVHEWAHLRWGVFDEYSKEKPFYMSAGQIEPTRCTNKISGQWYEITEESEQPCSTDDTGLPTSNCKFFPDKVQSTNASIMFMQSIESVKAFCHEEDHNIEAPNEQNEKCAKATRTVIFQDSVDKDALRNLKPLTSPPPAPVYKVIQRSHRVVCLVLDVSGSMQGPRIKLQKQAATIFLNQIIGEKQFVAIVTFSDDAVILSPLTQINGQVSRDNLIQKLPTIADGATYICKGLRKGFEALRNDDGKTIGDEIIFLTDGEATDNVQDCFQESVNSGAIIHTIALGPNADNVLNNMAIQTGGKFIVATDSISSNQLVNAFSSMQIFDGNYITQLIQLESTGSNVVDWFNGTVLLDRTVGNRTTFTIIYERSAPAVHIQSPSGLVYDESDAKEIAGTVTLTIPGTAEPGAWKYSFLNKDTAAQQMSLTVVSRAAREDVDPVTITAKMSQQTSDGTSPISVFVGVKQKYNPVLGATVWATLESDTGESVQLQLFDEGTGADLYRNDGIYSRYFTKLIKGKYNLKVRLENQQRGAHFSPHTHSGALYVPGYIVDGKVKLNPPKPPVNVQPVDVGSFSRTFTGESFVVETTVSINFPPNKITDLIGKIQEDTVFLNWTAPGDDLDEGTAKSYEIRWSENFLLLQNNFSDANHVNTSALAPHKSGSSEQYSFQLNTTINYDITLFIAIKSIDQQSTKSEISNIARATKYRIQTTKPPTSAGVNLNNFIVSLCLVTIMVCVII